MAAATDPAERLLNLVIALVNTSRRMTKEQVRRAVAGYGDAASDEAFERMFERDKDTLRDLGVPIVTVTGSAAHGDDVGYRIDQDAYALAPLELTPAELGALTLAAQLWQDQTLRTDGRRALTKLSAVAAAPGTTDLLAGMSPRVRAGGQALQALLDAVGERRVVRFTYRAATTGEVRERTVEPWQLLGRRGGWLLVGRDRDRDAPRSFRLPRIEGRVRVLDPAGAFVPPSPADLERALATWSAGEERVATLAVAPERAGALRARAVVPALSPGEELAGLPVAPGSPVPADLGPRDVLTVPYRSTAELAQEVVGYGEAVLVLDPPELRAAVIRLLRAGAGLDAGPDLGSDPGGARA